MEYAVKMEHINKAFSKVEVLKDVSFCLKPGEVHALMGENGAGKSTLMKILSGIYSTDGGTIEFYGQKVSIKSVQDAMGLGIALIHQEICAVPEMTIAENIFLAHVPAKFGIVKKKEREERALQLMKEFDLNIDVNTKLKDLNIAQQQMVEIIKALSQDVKVIIMDEPTSSLTISEIENLFGHIRRLKEQGTSIIYISHRMEETFEICDRLTVLRDGHLAGTSEVKDIDEDGIIKLMVGRNLDESFNEKIRPQGKEAILEVKNLETDKVHNISFQLKKGEILGFAGLVGAGRTETMNAIVGIDKIKSGSILLNGKEIKNKNMRQAIDNGIVLVPEDRKECGLVLSNTVRFNMLLPQLEKYIRFLHVNVKAEQEMVEEYSHKLSIRMHGPDQKAENLSGGNQQKIVISKWLACKPDILILDEPTRGIDVAAKAEIYSLIHQITEEGISVIMISSDLPEVMRISTRLAVLYEGNLQSIIEMSDDVTQEQVMYYAMGGK
ncbi:MAG: sugar ABC transporter ATP-binding protein [Lachnospiraceae bacterium]|nr:sugar ABC transporter ATP-binding protein [Lachnospiraceae bacterium]MDD3616396.1 sugar ABC transporter ATP-binding protein [Lachnospiraceae bacterium]